MIRSLVLATALTTAFAFQAIADDKKIIVDPPGPAPTTVIVEQTPEMKPDAAVKQPEIKSSPGAAVVAAPAQQNAGISLSEQEGKTWIDKPVYSSDGTKIGEVVAFQRDADKKVIGMHADIGGFWGFGQTRVNLTPAQFKLQSDRVVLGLTAAQAKELPKVQI